MGEQQRAIVGQDEWIGEWLGPKVSSGAGALGNSSVKRET